MAFTRPIPSLSAKAPHSMIAATFIDSTPKEAPFLMVATPTLKETFSFEYRTSKETLTSQVARAFLATLQAREGKDDAPITDHFLPKALPLLLMAAATGQSKTGETSTVTSPTSLRIFTEKKATYRAREEQKYIEPTKPFLALHLIAEPAQEKTHTKNN